MATRPPESAATTTPNEAFKAYAPGYVHVDVEYLPQLADENARRGVFVAIDRATRWVFIAIKAIAQPPRLGAS